MDRALAQNFQNSDITNIDGIEILVNWAKSGLIDPWNIDIVQVTDMFLQKLGEIKQNNLKLTGKTLFFAAVLLKLKSNYLEGIDLFKQEEELIIEAEEDTFDDNLIDFNDDEIITQSHAITLERAIVRRTSVRKNRTRKVSLDDLIREITKLEKIEEKKSRKAAEESVKARRAFTIFTPNDIMNLAHEENIEDDIEKLQTLLTRLFENNERLELKDLIEAGMDKASAYISLLFLVSRSSIDLVQESFYSELYIVKG